MIYNCCNENRKAAVLGNPTVNGIDYLEVLDHDAIPLGSPRHWRAGVVAWVAE